MGKGKKGGKRLTKKQLVPKLEELFSSNPGKTMSFKEIFRSLHLDTHPLKMLAIDIMEEMAWDDFITKVSDNSYQLNQKGQVQEGVFLRKTNGKNTITPDGSDKPIFVAERNSMWALSGDRVRFSCMARRKNHIKEAQVIEILHRAKETFVGRISIDHDLATLISPSNVLANSIIIPRRKLKGAKEGDNVVVKIMEWPDADHRNMIGEVTDVLGKSGDNDVEMNTILAQYGLPYKYPKNVEEAAEKISAEITPEDYAEREDFRDTFTCTIDPKDAKDFDDALSIKKLKDQTNRYLLQDDVTGEFPYRLLGKPVYLSDNMPAMASGAKAILYGDYSGLSVNFRENISVQILREKYATQHAIGVVSWFEFDAKVTDNAKLAVLTMKTTG